MGLVSPRSSGRTFTVRRNVRLADMDNRGRLRLDALARYLQDAAIDDVRETGWGLPEHLWFIRRIEIEVEAPFLDDTAVELVTWSSGMAAIAAGRRWSVHGDAGGHAEVDSVWIHLGPDGRPARIESFGVYADAAGGRRVSTKIELPTPPSEANSGVWPLRSTDIDLHDHVNNAVHWQAVEDRLVARGFDLRRPLGARLDYGDPLSLGDVVQLTEWTDGGVYSLVFAVDGLAKAYARVG